MLCRPASKSVSLFHGLYSHPVPSPPSSPSPSPSPFFRFLPDAATFSFAFFSALARTLASLLSFSALSRCCSSKLFGRRFSLNSSTSFSLSCARAASCAALAAGSEYIFSCASRKSLASRVAASLGVSVQSAIVDASRSTNVLVANDVTLPDGAPARGRICGGSLVIHSSRPASSSGGLGPFNISSSVGKGVPCSLRHSARSRSPASHSSNPSIFFFSSRTASMAARSVGSSSD